MPLLLFLLWFVEPQPVQAQYRQSVQHMNLVVINKYTTEHPCYLYVDKRNFQDITVCPSRQYFIVLATGVVLPVSEDNYNKQVIGQKYKV